MTVRKLTAKMRILAALVALLPAACAFFEPPPPASPLIGSWATADRNQVTFRPDAVVVSPEKGPATTLAAGECNGRYKLQYGRMQTAALENAFPTQPDLQSKLKQLLTKPEYPVADVTCDQGGTTYLMLNDRQMLAVYRDAGVGGVEAYSRL